MTGYRKTIQDSIRRASSDGPLVSVLISTYNRPAYLAEALESIFRQTYRNFEILLVRDGGLPVREVVEQFDDPRLHFIDRDQNRGLPYSFNEALSAARGEYICYLGDDDKFYPHHIAVLVDAIVKNPEYAAVYSDLYKAHCRVLPDGRRRVLSKNVEISRDFDRLLMLQFNHALHVSLIHRRDVFEHAGRYNEKLNVLIDWDLTRKLCFYTDFLHVPVVTGEYYAPVGQCDRISVQRRKNVSDYLRNLITIRTTRPPQPWPKVEDMAVVIVAQRADEKLSAMVRDLWSRTFYPNRIYIPLTNQEMGRFKCDIENVVPVLVADGDSNEQRLSRMLGQIDAPLTAILTAGINLSLQEAIYLERSVYPLLGGKNSRTIYEIKESDPAHFGAVGSTPTLRDAVERGYSALSAQSLQSAGLDVRKPRFDEYPFQFDNQLCSTEMQQIEGQWEQAAKIYDYLACHFGNEIWMQTRQANALYHAGRYTAAIELAYHLNQTRPTVTTYMIEARARKKMQDYKTAVSLYRQALAILRDESTGPIEQAGDTIRPKHTIKTLCTQPEETLVWT
jgi:glycosyltransferase involved in cell wall biosynthesis